MCNVVEPGDNVVIGMHGFFGGRIGEMVERYGGNVIRAEGEWGGPLDPKAVESALDSVDRVKMLAVVHGETSTGVLQPLEGFAAMAHERGALFLIDCVTSLAGVNVDVDGLGGRHRLLGDAEVPRRAAGAGAAHVQRAGARGGPRPEGDGRQLVSRHPIDPSGTGGARAASAAITTRRRSR